MMRSTSVPNGLERASRAVLLRALALLLSLPLLVVACDQDDRARLREASLISNTSDGAGPFVVQAVVDSPRERDTLTLAYSIDGGARWQPVPMAESAEGRYEGTIAPLDPFGVFFDEKPWPLGTEVLYYVQLEASERVEELPVGAPDAGAFAFVIGNELNLVAITSVSPLSGHTTGREIVFLYGGGFIDGMTVTFGGAPATQIEIVSPSFARALTPAHGVGPVDVVVANPAGRSARLDDGFFYVGAGACAHDGECAPGQTCDAGRCVDVPDCTVDEECPGGQICEFGRCQPTKCASDRDCQSGFVCQASHCIPQRPCSSDAECAPLGMVCRGGACVFGEECQRDQDCPVGFGCVFGACVELPDECQRDQDCPPELVCEFGFCTEPPQCRWDAECPFGFLCAFGQCIPGGCSAGEPCPAGTVCDFQINACVPGNPCGGPCPPNMFCDPDRRACVECMGPQHCPPGWNCSSGSCSPECGPNQPCPVGFVCDPSGMCIPNDVCSGIVCPDGWFCDPFVGGCVPLDLCQGVPCPPGTACDPRTGRCDPLPQCTNNGQCNDGRPCNGQERCVDQVCQPGQPIACPTPDPCVFGQCVGSAGGCVYEAAPDGAPCPWGVCVDGFCNPMECFSSIDCDNGDPCDGTEVCLNGSCLPGQPEVCDDGSPCTRDFCLSSTGQCSSQLLPDGTSCGNGQICLSGICVGAGCTSDGQCSDGRVCNGTEACVGGACVPGQPPSCGSTDPCTVGQCSEPVGCTTAPAPDGTSCGVNAICLSGTCLVVGCGSDAQCDDGVRCNGAERCVAGTCEAGPGPSCNDANPCTNDRCTEAQGCTNTPVPDGASCGAGAICLGGTCLGAMCNTDADCDDGASCTGVERCLAGACAPGVSVSCADSNPCTADTCNEPFASCVNSILPDGTPCSPDGRVCQNGLCGMQACFSDTDCDDGLQCNGRELCLGGQCFPGPPVQCDDGNLCTLDFCDEATGGCSRVPGPDGLPCGPGGETCQGGLCVGGGVCNGDFDCDDGLVCNGRELCDAAGSCTGGAPLCEDFNPCTFDECLEPFGACNFFPEPDGMPCGPNMFCVAGQCGGGGFCLDPGDCDDGIGCNGEEFCDDFTGTCIPGFPPDCGGLVGPCRAPMCVEDGTPDGTCSGTSLPNGTPCVNGGSCQSGVCTHPPGGCRTDADCMTPLTCNPFTSQCELPLSCSSQFDCPAGEICVGGSCEQVTPCNSTWDCPAGTICMGDICYTAPDCYSDLDCPAGEQCEVFACQPTTCSSDAECDIGWDCRANRCVPPAYCQDDADCPLFGLQCINFTCQNPGGCSSDAQCPPGQSCLWGACFFLPPAECSYDEDCGPGESCYLGYCQMI